MGHSAIAATMSPERSTLVFDPNKAGVNKRNSKGQPIEYRAMDGNRYNDNASAYLMRALMKQRETKQGTLSKMFDSGRWNGQGKVIIDGQVVADADNHAAKLKRMDIPENQGILQRFQQMLEKGGYDPFFDARDLQNQASLE
jgi:hypothetical protein